MKIIKYLLVLGLFFISISIVVVFNYFNKNFGYPPKLLINTISTAYKLSKTTPDKINFLILGTDIRDDWLETSQDTDTIILASLDTKNYVVNLVSVPRDIWYSPINSRINKIYSQSLQSPNPIDFIKSKFNEITGQNIDYVLIINTDILSKLMDITGPVLVDLPYSFTDDQYPDPNHISDPQNFPNPYITISFEKGPNVIDTKNIDYFVRSRKGADVQNGGTDLGRSARQQLLIMALFDSLAKIDPIKNIKTFSTLYKLWSTQITKDITDTTLLSLIFKLNKNIINLSFKNITIPIGLNSNDTNGVIYHPKYFSSNAWVYLPTKNDFSNLWQYLDGHLN